MRLTLAAGLLLALVGSAGAMDFTQKQECVIERPGRVAMHTHCLVVGSMQGGTFYDSITPTGNKAFTLEGPIDGEDGHRFLLQKSEAYLDKTGIDPCYRRRDGRLGICLGQRLD